MKWYFWILIIVAVLIIVFVIRYKMTNRKPSKLETQILNGDYGDILNDGLNSTAENSRKIVEDLIQLQAKIESTKPGSFSYEKIKELAANQGVLVLMNSETRTMEYNSKRVILKTMPVYCIKAPCPQGLVIESVG